MKFVALTPSITVSIYSIDKKLNPHEIRGVRPVNCVYFQCYGSSNPVDTVRPCPVSSTLTAFRQNGLVGFEGPVNIETRPTQ